VPEGSAILLLIGSANRDERRYDEPDAFDIHRDNAQHLTFGYGLHYCHRPWLGMDADHPRLSRGRADRPLISHRGRGPLW
jgi:hypothetical protein